MPVIPHAPFSPGIQAYTWFTFLPVFVYFFIHGQRMTWIKVQPYIVYALQSGDTDDDARFKQAGQVSARMMWIYMLYAYAYAYVRVVIFFLWVALVVIVIRMMVLNALRITPKDNSEGDERTAPKDEGKNPFLTILDARSILEFMHYRHWPHHVYAFGIYVCLTLLLSFLLMGTRKVSQSMSEVTRAYHRTVILSTTMVFMYYTIYAIRCMMSAKEMCAPAFGGY